VTACRIVFWLILLVPLPPATLAHTRSTSHSIWEINEGSVDVVLTLPVVEANRIGPLQSPPSDTELSAYFTTNMYPIAGEVACRLIPPVQPLSATTGFRKLDFTFKCPDVHNLRIHFAGLFELIPSHTDFAQVQNAATGEFMEQLFTLEHQTIDVTGGESEHLKNARFSEFVRMGVMHIFTGIDHMAFLLGLVMISRRVRELMLVVTGFTIGHSLTLALAVTGVLRPHGEFIDALVALTIALIGAENVVALTRRPTAVSLIAGGSLAIMMLLRWAGWGGLPILLLLGAGLFSANYLMISGKMRDAGRLRLLITLVFGLIHGFGFAADLLELQLPPQRLAELLVGFNLGVEVGQLTIVLAATMLVVTLRRLRWALPRPLVVSAGSGVLMCLGIFWFVTRSSRY
jgi:hypothetical protein